MVVAEEPADLTLVEKGKSNYQIVIAPDAKPVTARAAKDLQTYLRKSTGALLPIVKTGVSGGKASIIVGDCKAARGAGIDISSLKPESYVIRTVGKNLYIAGYDTKGSASSDHWRSAPQSGTWYGVADFLERFLGVRWFFPGEKGEYVPVVKKLKIPSIDYSYTPPMSYRVLSYRWGDLMPRKRILNIKDWNRRNRGGKSIIWSAAHVWRNYFKASDYFKDHPEWFALVNGVRRMENSSLGPQMCTTNKGALDKFAEIIINEHRKRQGVMFSLSPNDGGGHCECSKCRALDVETLPSGEPVLTDRYITYCNEVAKRVNAVLPDQTFGFIAYSYYSNPPVRTRVDPHVKIMHVLNDIGVLYYSGKLRKMFVKKLKGWKEAVGQLYFYSHPPGMGNLALPSMHPQVIKRIVKDLNSTGITGAFIAASEPEEATGLNNYLYLKMLWNPNTDFDALYEDALNKCYGPGAAPLVRKYYELVEAAISRYANKITVNTSIGSARRFPGLLDYSYPGLYSEGMPILQKALRQPMSKRQKECLLMLIENLEYCRDTVMLYQLAKNILSGSKPDKNLVIKALKLAKKRREYQSKVEIRSKRRKSIGEWEKVFNLPFAAIHMGEYSQKCLRRSKKIRSCEN